MGAMYSRQNPYQARLKEIYRLNKEGSLKEIFHIVLDIEGSGIRYEVGDSVGILPSHDLELIALTLSALGMSGDEIIEKQGRRTLKEHLTSYANITRLQKPLLEVITGSSEDPGYELWDSLLSHPQMRFTPQEIVDRLPPLLPRFYSIASAQEVHPEEIHLTIAMADFVSCGKQRRGVGTHFLCRLARHQPVPLYIQPSNGFTLPQDHHPIIMVGPGTGIAPFRAFMQKRMAQKALGKNWLFFGEQYSAYDFFYEELWRDLEAKGHLHLDLAFSRDHAQKLYVQHKMEEKQEKLWQWLQEGAYLFVCGDADRMAKDVDQTLHKIAAFYLSSDAAKTYIRTLRKEKRYLRDVY